MTRLKLPSRLNFKSSSLRLIECSRIRTILDTLPATQRKEKSISKKILSIFPKFQHYPKIVARSFIDSKKKFHASSNTSNPRSRNETRSFALQYYSRKTRDEKVLARRRQSERLIQRYRSRGRYDETHLIKKGNVSKPFSTSCNDVKFSERKDIYIYTSFKFYDPRYRSTLLARATLKSKAAHGNARDKEDETLFHEKREFSR